MFGTRLSEVPRMVRTLAGKPIGQAELSEKNKSPGRVPESKGENTMKKRIQKYLAGEREGFSLVELIIVIAIMAILIGVIALAVLPNINRSRESKDISQLDSIASAANAAIAVVQAKGAGTIVCGGTDAGVTAGSGTTEQAKIQKQIADTVAAGAGKTGSTAASVSGAKIVVSYDTTTKAVQAAYCTGITSTTAAFTDLNSAAIQCAYLEQKFIVGGNS